MYMINICIENRVCSFFQLLEWKRERENEKREILYLFI